MNTKNRYRIYVVEDDEMLADEISRLLVKWGYEVRIAEIFDSILDEFLNVEPHVVLMDVNIPYFDGFYWCKKIRDTSAVPIIYISSRDSSMDVIMGMNNGGDDYLTKPFDNTVLIAKLQAVIRRAYEYSFQQSNILQYQGLIVHLEEGTAAYDNKKCELTKNELKILRLLIENQGKIVTREALMRRLWDDEVYVNENTLTVNVNRVRLKLEELGLQSFITTKKGMGYLIL
ncbi:response regulator protein GraR [Oxobacter pfennigii]|uniref:Stage 0 sporulation protein A homolog n=1 Tax=Oxobacter pfennigii TaxID=36849 RepID=A0A0P9AE31_9CLOT|nr:response regulator transcription factor [Oxobacter pfennigii]KPU43507.1 response regulator protein GraR [Oxobacter pfennigii]